MKTAPAPAKIQAHQPMPTPAAKTAALKPKDPSSRSGEQHKSPAPLYGGAGSVNRQTGAGIGTPENKPAAILSITGDPGNGKREPSILRELWGDNEDDYPEMIARFLKKPSGNSLAGDAPQDQRTETVERLFPAEDRFRLPERRSEGLGRMEAGKPFPEQEEKPERAPGRERIRPMRASGRLQHEDMPPEQFSGVVPYDGGWEAEEVEMHPEMEAEAHKREVNTNRVDLPEYSSFDGSQTGKGLLIMVFGRGCRTVFG